jgi:MFS family permease
MTSQDRQAGAPPSELGRATTPLRRIIAASTAGTALEWYDFFLYGLAAALVFAPLYFPTSDALTGTLLSFSTFAVGFVARPIGAIIAGHFGDRTGRVKVLTITIVAMGLASFLIGCIPTYASIGVWAPVLLVVVRFVQGLALGGEWAGSVLLISENTDGHHRGFFASFIQSSSPLGNVLATGVFVFLNAVLSNEAFLSYGWRIAFWLSAIVTLVGLYVRLRVSETPAFAALQEHSRTSKVPLVTLLSGHWRTALACIGIRVGSDTAWTVFAVVSITYVTAELGLSRSVALNATLIAAVMQVVTHALAGALSDRIGRRPAAVIGVAGLALWTIFFFRLLDGATPTTITIAIVGGLALHSLVYGPMAAWFVEVFPTHIRYSGASVSHQVASLGGGAIAPLIAIGILAATDSTFWIVVYVLIALLIGMVGSLALPETRGTDLSGDDSTTPMT